MFLLPLAEWLKIGKGAVVAAVGAALAFLTSVVGSVDFGPNGPFVGAVLAVAFNAFRKVAGLSVSPADESVPLAEAVPPAPAARPVSPKPVAVEPPPPAGPLP